MRTTHALIGADVRCAGVQFLADASVGFSRWTQILREVVDTVTQGDTTLLTAHRLLCSVNKNMWWGTSSFYLFLIHICIVSASHYRFGNIAWRSIGGRTVAFDIGMAWRRSAFGNRNVGASISVGSWITGDGGSVSINALGVRNIILVPHDHRRPIAACSPALLQGLR